MKKIVFIAISLILTYNNVFSQKLSQYSQISIITCGPGDQLYSTFGHSAIRVTDPAQTIDNVYNYGTFDFETKGFYLKFMRGKLDYMLSVSTWRYFLVSYVNENRWVKQQILNLTPKQKQSVFDFLQNNAKPENKFYRYDFFFDNCATRVKDVIKANLGANLILGTPLIDTSRTFKDIINPYIENKDWPEFGIYLALGFPSDKIATYEQSTFIPDYLSEVMKTSLVIYEGDTIPLVGREMPLYIPNGLTQEEKIVESSFFNSIFITWTIFGIILILTFFEFYFKKNFYFIDNIIFFILGFIGLGVLFLWLGTDHKSVVNNLNVIWANPFYIIAIFLYHKDKFKPFTKIFFLFAGIISLWAIFPKPFFPQKIDIAFIPLILSGALRGIYFYFKNGNVKLS
jgi:hypothetical protein